MHCARLVEFNDNNLECDACLELALRVVEFSFDPFHRVVLCESCVDHAKELFQND